MLDFLRVAVKSWVAKVLLGLLVASFAVFGIGDVFTNSVGTTVARVGDQKIDAEAYANAFQSELRRLSQQVGQPIDSQMARSAGIDQQVLARMMQEATLDQAMADLGISAPDSAVSDEIVGDPNFQNAGAFDEARYRYVIAQAGFRPEDYEEEIRKALARQQLAAALSVGAAPPPGAIEILYEWQGELRRFDYFVLTTQANTETPEAPSEAALVAFHEENAAIFSAPEQRTATYLHVSIDELAKGVEVDELTIRELYEARGAEYVQPETRALYQIIFDTEEEAKAAKARLDAAETDFDGLLAERNETREDASLGDALTPDQVQAATADAAFALEVEGVTDPVSTGFGYALIDVAAITPALTIPFEDAKDELSIALRRDGALDQAPGLAGQIEDLRAGGMTLEEAASDMNLPILKADSIDREGGEGFTADPTFLNELFTAETGEYRDMIETPEGDFFVLRVEAVKEAALRPLEEVREQVVAYWTASERRAALTAKATALVDRADEGELLAALADAEGVDLQTEGPLTRVDQWTAMGPELVQVLFAENMGGAASGPVPGRADSIVIAQVVDIQPAERDENTASAIAGVTQERGRWAGADTLSFFIRAKQREAGIETNQAVINSLMTQGGGGY
ncbi:MAG: SurA N-terminal domain-containing protein [Pikeienuella sp.]